MVDEIVPNKAVMLELARERTPLIRTLRDQCREGQVKKAYIIKTSLNKI